jgi:hypothetical protein
VGWPCGQDFTFRPANTDGVLCATRHGLWVTWFETAGLVLLRLIAFLPTEGARPYLMSPRCALGPCSRAARSVPPFL